MKILLIGQWTLGMKINDFLICHLVALLKYGDCYMTSRIIVENHLAGWFEYLMCQQMAPGPALFLTDYKSLLLTIKIFKTARQMILY